MTIDDTLLEIRRYSGLQDLASSVSLELSKYLQGNENEFTYTKDFIKLLDTHTRDNDILIKTDFPYALLVESIREKFGRQVVYSSDLAVEMRILSNRLKDLKDSRTRIKELRDFFSDLGNRFGYYKERNMKIPL